MGWFRTTNITNTASGSTVAKEKNAERTPSDTPDRSSPGSRFQHAVNPHAGNNTPLYYSSFDSGSRSTQSIAVRDIKCEVVANWLHAKAEEKMWTSGSPAEGVFVKRTKGSYAHCPADLASDSSGLYPAITALNVRVRWMYTILLSRQ